MTTKNTHSSAQPKVRARPAKTKTAKFIKRKNGAATAKPAIKRSRPSSIAASPRTPAASQNKQAKLIALLRSAKGGTIHQMTTLTGWQPHTIRGTISSVLRKRLGLNIECATRVGDAARVYRIVGAIAA